MADFDDSELLAHRQALSWGVEKDGWGGRRKLAAAEEGVVGVGQRVKLVAGAKKTDGVLEDGKEGFIVEADNDDRPFIVSPNADGSGEAAYYTNDLVLAAGEDGSVDEAHLLAFLREAAYEQGWQGLSAEEKAQKQSEGKVALEKESSSVAEERAARLEIIALQLAKTAEIIGEGAAAASCQKGHPLVQFNTPSGGYGCDHCGSRVPVGAAMHGCRKCDFDLCEACAALQLAKTAAMAAFDASELLAHRQALAWGVEKYGLDERREEVRWDDRRKLAAAEAGVVGEGQRVKLIAGAEKTDGVLEDGKEGFIVGLRNNSDNPFTVSPNADGSGDYDCYYTNDLVLAAGEDGSVDEAPLLAFLREAAYEQGWQGLSAEEKAQKQSEGEAALKKELSPVAWERFPRTYTNPYNNTRCSCQDKPNSCYRYCKVVGLLAFAVPLALFGVAVVSSPIWLQALYIYIPASGFSTSGITGYCGTADVGSNCSLNALEPAYHPPYGTDWANWKPHTAEQWLSISPNIETCDMDVKWITSWVINFTYLFLFLFNPCTIGCFLFGIGALSNNNTQLGVFFMWGMTFSLVSCVTLQLFGLVYTGWIKSRVEVTCPELLHVEPSGLHTYPEYQAFSIYAWWATLFGFVVLVFTFAPLVVGAIATIMSRRR